ncbi:hypothetical protein [Spirosoma utsteinense]|uniref:Uncharacterized protein n=1 Tax=Spirosoma utsteinense TaxID=2585773 RepID=A0ABR6W4J4_9BACT|nr:hypothetical protein [Spirosoma utsteinense]MBC3787064.1 hypothetical protein [Spirosoma utsteinense]MBC3791387.1 hypothetical protein [Spirosoma utsteinense]
MIRMLTLIWLFACPIDGHSQAQDSKTFIQDYFGAIAKLIYRDRLDSHQLDAMKSALNKDTLYGLRGIAYDSSQILILSPQERTYIDQALVKLAGIRWDRDLFKYGHVMSEDSLEAIFMGPKHRGWSYFRQHYGTSLQEFSNPIFIRDNTVCIFYSGHTCDYECGEGSLSIFRQENGNWHLWMKLYTWMS